MGMRLFDPNFRSRCKEYSVNGIALIGFLGADRRFCSPPFTISLDQHGRGSLTIMGLHAMTALLLAGGLTLLIGVPASMLHEPLVHL
jgi:hypothetical protein